MAATYRVTVRHGAPGPLGGLRLAGSVTEGLGVLPRTARAYPGHAAMLVTRGSGRYRDPRHDLPLAAGDAVLVFPGHPHWYGVTGPGTWDETFLVFEGPLFVTAERSGLIDRRRPVLRLGAVEPWSRRMAAFRTRPAPRAAAARQVEACDLLRLLVELVAAGGGGAGPDAPPSRGWRETSLDLLSADLSSRLDLTDVAARVGMTYETWRRHFRAEVGEPPARYRLRRRIEAAESMLRLTALPVREIAAAVGFSDEQHLARHLKDATGLTPRRYRAAGRGAGGDPGP